LKAVSLGELHELAYSRELTGPEPDVEDEILIPPKDVRIDPEETEEREPVGDAQCLSPWKVEFNKAFVKVLSTIRHRAYIDKLFPMSTCYYNHEYRPGVKGKLALTINEAPGQRGAAASLIPEMRALLKQFAAQATFFCCTDWLPEHEASMKTLLEDGHEVATQGPLPRSYSEDTEEQFDQALVKSEQVLQRLREGAGAARAHDGHPSVKWFRSPMAILSNTMQNVLNRHGYTHVLGDCYANDPWISDPQFISDTMLQHAEFGSVVVLHMPEKGFREYNKQALEKFLQGCKDRSYQVVSLSQLYEAAYSEQRDF